MDRMDSPSKRRKNFNNLLSFWVGPEGVVRNCKLDNRLRHSTYFMNTTQPGLSDMKLPNTPSNKTNDVEPIRAENEMESGLESDPKFGVSKVAEFSSDGF